MNLFWELGSMSFHPPSRKATSDGGRRELGEAVQSWFDEVEDFPSSNVDPFRTVLPTGISTCIQKTSQIWHILIFNFFLEGGLFTYCLACKFCHGPTSWQRCLSQAHQGQGDRPLHPGGLGRVNPRRMRLHLQIRRGQAEIPIPGGADGTGGGSRSTCRVATFAICGTWQPWHGDGFYVHTFHSRSLL